jgi:hypothetical protein
MLPHPIHLSPELPLHFVVESAMDKKDWTPEDEALKVQLQNNYGIFKSPRITRTTDTEYPPQA